MCGCSTEPETVDDGHQEALSCLASSWEKLRCGRAGVKNVVLLCGWTMNEHPLSKSFQLWGWWGGGLTSLCLCVVGDITESLLRRSAHTLHQSDTRTKMSRGIPV